MKDLTRRNFLAGMASTAAAMGLPKLGHGYALPGEGGKYDLVVSGGEVIDPSQNLRGKKDIGIHYGRIVAIEDKIPGDQATRSYDATGKLVLPGLVDYHAHVCPDVTAISIPADELIPYSAVSTYVSAGDCGANNISAFKHYIIPKSRSRIFGYVHISMIGLAGFPVPEALNIKYCNVEFAAKALAENPDILLGVKVRIGKSIVGENGLEPLKNAIKAAERSDVKGARVMCHIGGAPGDLSDLLDLLRPGDVLTHCYSGGGNNIVQNGKLLPAALEAKKRGVIFDVGHGGGSFDFTIAEPAIQQGAPPDTVSTDIHIYSANAPGRPQMPWLMSKFLALGFSLEEVITMTTQNPAKLIGKVDKLGTLQLGAIADVSILELVEEETEFIDSGGGGKRLNKRKGSRYLKPVKTILAGRPFGTPHPPAPSSR